MRFSSLFYLTWTLYIGCAVAMVCAAESKPVVPITASPTASPASSAPSPRSIPTLLMQLGNAQATVPDWGQISFAALPPLASSGSIGNRYWVGGETLDQVLKLEDFQDSFKLQNLNLYSIALGSRSDPKTVSLAQFKLIQQQTLQDLVSAVPDLGQQTVKEVPPIAALLAASKPDYQLDELTPLSVVIEDPNLGTLKFNHFDLTGYSLEDIPGLLQAPIANFQGWQAASIDDIPGLKSLPWSQFIGPPANGAQIGVIELPDADEAGADYDAISGSAQNGWAARCSGSEDGCPSIGFAQNSELANRRWIGATQRVQGGRGKLAEAGDGLEPTGRNLYGDAFKVALEQIGPSGVATALYFQACTRLSILDSTTCTPYAIGPVPFQHFRIGDPMLVGLVPRHESRETSLNFRPTETLIVPNPTPRPLWQEWLGWAFRTLEGWLNLGGDLR